MEQQNQTTPPAPESYGKQMWQMWGPLVIKWGIAFGIMMVAGGVFSFIYMSANYEMTVEAMQSQDKMMELYTSIAEQLLGWETLIEGVAALVTIPVMLVFFHKDRVKEKLVGIIPNKKAPAWKYLAQIIMAIAMSWAVNNLIVISGIYNNSEAYTETMAMLYSPPLFIQIICLGILIPICEELVFRGLMFSRMRARTGFLRAALYTSVVFGLIHMNMVQMLYAFVLGMMLCYVYEKYGSVKAPILAHIAMNLFSVLATYFKLDKWASENTMDIAIITVVCAAAASTMFVFIQRIEEKPESSEEPLEKNHLEEG